MTGRLGPVTFIGDVHGWTQRLDHVLSRAVGLPVLMGDLIDRGPDSRGVVRLVRGLTASGIAACLMGNHEYALVRGLGVPELGIEEEPDLFAAWWHAYGGRDTGESYGVHGCLPGALRQAMGDDLLWMAQLPWVLEGGMPDGRGWIAVHGGLAQDRPWRQQVEELRQPERWWRAPARDGSDAALHAIAEGEPGADEPDFWLRPPALYDKLRAVQVPDDLPPHLTVVSGHTPLPKPLIDHQRLLVDTSGGRIGRPLSGVIWPEGRVVASDPAQHDG